jgi:hypothetical protein
MAMQLLDAKSELARTTPVVRPLIHRLGEEAFND